MSVWRSMSGMVEAILTSADTAAALTDIQKAGIMLYETSVVDELTLRLHILRRDYNRLKRLAERKGSEVQLTGRRGLYWTVVGLLRRPVLIAGILLLILLSACLPTRIFFIRVEGNVHIPANLILEQASDCGISFGAERRTVRSEGMKNALLEAMPELQWAGVNTRGCVAVISVREREITEQTPPLTGVSSLIAVRDGVILSCTVTRGSAVCRIGQAVKAGEVLISGYTDCGISIRASQAQGEVFAQTERALSVLTPENCLKKGPAIGAEKKYSLLIGKKRINLFKGSGISDASCDRIYVERYMTLPGGFRLPICLITETWVTHLPEEATVLREDIAPQLSGFARTYLSSEMVGGQIVFFTEHLDTAEGAFCLVGRYACHEMIGRVQKEEIVTPYGKSDGENR